MKSLNEIRMLALALSTFGLVFCSSTAAQAQVTTECQTTGTKTKCVSRETKPPLDYAGTLNAGQDLVPPIEPVRESRVVPTPAGRPDQEYIPSDGDYFFTGNGLLRSCKSSLMSRGYLACAAFVRAVSETVPGIASVNGGRELACIPKGVMLGQLIDVVKKVLESAPEVRHESAAPLVAVALIRAFPCPKDTEGK